MNDGIQQQIIDFKILPCKKGEDYFTNVDKTI